MQYLKLVGGSGHDHIIQVHPERQAYYHTSYTYPGSPCVMEHDSGDIEEHLEVYTRREFMVLGIPSHCFGHENLSDDQVKDRIMSEIEREAKNICFDLVNKISTTASPQPVS